MKPAIALALFIIASLYLGIGGITQVDLVRMEKAALEAPDDPIDYDGVIYNNDESVKAFRESAKVRRVFPWIGFLPEFAGLAITAVAFGALGGCTRVIKQVVIDEYSLADLPVAMRAVYGGMLGLMILGLSYVLPAALTNDEDVQLRSTTLIFLCFFAGVYTVKVHQWLERQVDRIFPTEEGDAPDA